MRRLLLPVIGRGRRFARDEKAATAVEFGILALPFFTVIFAIIETSVVFLAGQILDSAVNDSSRHIRTRQAQAAGDTADDYRAAVCKGLFGMFDCDDHNRLRIRVSEVDSFGETEPMLPLACDEDTGSCNWSLVEAYDPGGASSIIMVEAYYKWPTIVNLPWFDLATLPDGTRLLAAVRIFRNEP